MHRAGVIAAPRVQCKKPRRYGGALFLQTINANDNKKTGGNRHDFFRGGKKTVPQTYAIKIVKKVLFLLKDLPYFYNLKRK